MKSEEIERVGGEEIDSTSEKKYRLRPYFSPRKA